MAGRLIYNLVPFFKILCGSTDKTRGVPANILKLITDFKRQYLFGVNLIRGVCEENPEYFDQDVKDRIAIGLQNLYLTTCEMERRLFGTNDTLPVAIVLTHRILNDIGSEQVLETPPFLSEDAEWFIKTVIESETDYNSGSVTITQNGHLSWD